MSKRKEQWTSHRVGRQVTVVRWGEFGTPVLLFPTAGGDAEEVERFHMIDALGGLLAEGRIKVYSVDSVAAQRWLGEQRTTTFAGRVHNEYDEFLVHEVVPFIRADCGGDPGREVIAAGASIGAFNALASLCRHPDVFAQAVCMSGTYDLTRFLSGPVDAELYRASPLHFLPGLPEGPHLARLRTRFVLLLHGEGRAESPEESWKVAHALGARGVPNRVVSWGRDWPHDWVTWRRMLPQYLSELVPAPR
ncbi:MAG TPA: alpha/beta hydrolase-fold protein [Planctomycetota bacterium]|nr:alpha/beta hydrolase-fold protein [Planctomycetota bacterium]